MVRTFNGIEVIVGISNASAIAPRVPLSPWKIVYRILKWTTLAGAVLSLVLILHKAPPPHGWNLNFRMSKWPQLPASPTS